MVTALIGPMPSDWGERLLGEFCDLTAGASIAEDAAGTVAIVKPKNLVLGRVLGPTDCANSEEASRRDRYRVRDGDLLAARTGSTGRVSLATAEEEGWVFGTGIIRIRPRGSVDPLYLSFYFTHPVVREWFAAHSSGTAIPSINTKTLGSLPVVLPPLGAQRAIGQTLDALNQQITAHEQVIQASAELRDSLLPLLLSGRARP